MYGFSNNEQLKAFKGAELIQVCIGLNDIALIFAEPKCEIRVFSVDAFVRDNAAFCQELTRISGIETPFGRRITFIDVQDDRHARISFDNGRNLLLEDDNDSYEAVSFHLEGSTVIVV